MLAMIVPLGLGFFIIIILVTTFVIVKITGVEFVEISFLPKFEKILIYFTVAIILLPYAILKILHVYVYFKLKKKGIPQGHLT
jgi:cytochrome b subunit of formate dehydrogenase